ncbi:MAG: histidine kinase [Parabacteroides sp.]|nr:histidine kinase [Parabacteroides sp.]
MSRVDASPLSVVLIRSLRSKQEVQLAYEQLKSEKLQTSYNALMGQINPHFFFNSLNGLSSLVRQQKQEQTLTYLDELSGIFRYVLQSNTKELVTLAEELQFVKAYTYLLQVRYEGKFSGSGSYLYGHSSGGWFGLRSV